MAKTKTIRLSFPHSRLTHDRGQAQLYQVEQITDSLDFAPGDVLTRKQADDLCAAPGWKVTIVPVKTA